MEETASEYVAEGSQTEMGDGSQEHLRGQVEDFPSQLDAERPESVGVGVEKLLRLDTLQHGASVP